MLTEFIPYPQLGLFSLSVSIYLTGFVSNPALVTVHGLHVEKESSSVDHRVFKNQIQLLINEHLYDTCACISSVALLFFSCALQLPVPNTHVSVYSQTKKGRGTGGALEGRGQHGVMEYLALCTRYQRPVSSGQSLLSTC